MTATTDRIRSRVITVAIVVFAMLAALLVRLWHLQVLEGDQYRMRASRNAVRIVIDEAPRGKLVDRAGRVLVRNRAALAIGVRRQDLPTGDEGEVVRDRLASLLGTSRADLDDRLTDVRTAPLEPVVVARDVLPRVVFTIRERADRFPGVEAMTLPVREYPRGSLGAHLIGYLSEVTEPELLGRPTYRPGDQIGRTGLERTLEEYIRGVPGRRKLEVDASGNVLRVLGRQNPYPGANVRLTLDLGAQRVAEQALADGIRRARAQVFTGDGRYFEAPAGAVVVMDAQTGAVRAMASAPTFDLNAFVGGITDAEYRGLTAPGAHEPLLDRALQAAYPPGSTFKPIIATAALSEGAATTHERFPCKTEFRFGDRIFRNWRPRNSHITLRSALIESCDTPFYVLARDWWLGELREEDAGRPPREIIQEYARAFGLDEPTGIELSGSEEDGRIPDRRWRLGYWEANRDSYCRTAARTKDPLLQDLCERGYRWRGGDTVNLSIGQGDILTSPLQMAVAYAALGNGGKVLTPYLWSKVTAFDGTVVARGAPKVRGRVGASKAVQSYVRSALIEVARTGTAAFPYRGWPHDLIPVAAKTGSAEIAGRQPYSWFASFAPAGKPRYVVVAVVEEAGYGSQVAGPVVRRVMDELFGQDPLPIVFGTASD